jgi:hypothetical protein
MVEGKSVEIELPISKLMSMHSCCLITLPGGLVFKMMTDMCFCSIGPKCLKHASLFLYTLETCSLSTDRRRVDLQYEQLAT